MELLLEKMTEETGILLPFNEVPTYELAEGKIKTKGKMKPKGFKLNPSNVEKLDALKMSTTPLNPEILQAVMNKMMGHMPEEKNDYDLVPYIDADGREIVIPRSTRDELEKQKKAGELDAYWTTNKGEKLKISDMKTLHLFNSLRLVYNKLVPPNYRIDVKDASNFNATFPSEEGKYILQVMFYQIGKRENLTDEQFDKLQAMASVVRDIL